MSSLFCLMCKDCHRYPFVMKYRAYPCGGRKRIAGKDLPQSITTAEELRKHVRGFMHCRVSLIVRKNASCAFRCVVLRIASCQSCLLILEASSSSSCATDVAKRASTHDERVDTKMHCVTWKGVGLRQSSNSPWKKERQS